MNEEQLNKALELATSLMRDQDVGRILDTVVGMITDDFGFEACDAFLLDEESNEYVLRATKGFPVDVADKVYGMAKSRSAVDDDLTKTEKIGKFTYLLRAEPDTNGTQYYSLLHPERASQPRRDPGSWHELDVLYVTFQDAEGKIVGFLEPDGPRDGKLPSKSLVGSLEVFASLASVAMTNARLVSALNRTVKLFRNMLDITVAMQQPVELKDALKMIAERLNELVPFDEVSVYIVDWDSDLLIPLYATGPFTDEVMADIGPLSGLAGMVARSGKVEIAEDSTEDPRVEDIPGLEQLEVRQTMMAIPLKGRHGVEGVLELYRDKSRQFNQVEVAIAEPFAAHAAIALENARLREELKENLDAVKKAYEDMKDLDLMKDSLVDTITHELRTPLTTILGYIEMTSSGMYGEVTPKMREKFCAVIDQTRRINTLVSTMLEMSRIQSKDFHLDFSNVNLAMVTHEVVDDLTAEINAKNHSVSVLFGRELPIVQADRVRIHDVIENLVSNAVKYTDNGGRITIGADILGGKVHMWVRDNGVGIAEEDHDRLFDRFFLADAGLTRADGRVGIGLYTSREIVRRHGGEIWFESRKGAGSTFHFSLPMKQKALI
ncbi:MAG: GAF domain-containing sensor histidine kinase [Candidatus Thermoplasmatota archaeon]|nr:GAF domain-containing sensor histidine kinase [Candidatus Thermoplasmatota archaeon]